MPLNKPFLKIMSVFGAVLLVTVDQFIKHSIRQEGGFYVCNKGISFGIQFGNILFWLILALILLFIAFQLILNKKSLSGLLLFSLGLIVGGALSNILDRFLFGCVFDYIIIPVYKILPAFNLADIGISIGSWVIIFLLLFKKQSD